MKKYLFAAVNSILIIIVFSTFLLLFDIYSEFVIGWFGATSYFMTIFYFKQKEFDLKVKSNIEEAEMNYNLLLSKNEELKNDNEFLKTQSNNLKSEIIVNNAMKKQ